MSTRGVSVVICSHNGAHLLPRTLEYLLAQKVPADLAWELVLIDNASTDGTGEAARRIWAAGGRMPIRVVNESRLGLSFARECGLEHARYEYVSFIDDDNWVGENWVSRVAEVMDRHTEAGAVGGYSEAVPEVPPPDWFSRFKNYYAIGPDYQKSSEVPMLWGAGLNLRRSVWRRMQAQGFRFLTEAQSEDREICLALRLAGWKLWFDPELALHHFIPAKRLEWRHFLALQRKRTKCLVAVDAYIMALAAGAAIAPGNAGAYWINQVARTTMNLLINLALRPKKFFARSAERYEGDEEILRIECYRGRLEGLRQQPRRYTLNMRAIACAGWRNAGPCAAQAAGRDAAPADVVA